MTPMHFQYLVGICCLRCQPDAVEMTLGDRVRDAVSESDRDVDVTITLGEPDGMRTAFMGYEAKMEKGALDVADVEQLVAKLTDMPDLTTRAIVSAKGFSETAIRKATKRGVKLFEFREWKESVKAGFPVTSMDGPPVDTMLFGQREFRWIEPIQPCRVNPEDPSRAEYVADIKNDMPLFQADGAPHPKYDAMPDFMKAFTAAVSGELAKLPESEAVWMQPRPYPPNEQHDGPLGDPVHFPQLMCPIEEPVYFQTRKGLRRLEMLELSASLQWHHKRVAAEFRIMVDVQSGEIYSGAGITTHPIHADVLVAVTFSPENALVHMRMIRLTDKQKNFIHRLKVRV